MNFLELFAGDRSFGKVAEKQGMRVFSVDWEDYDNIDLNIDIEVMTREHIPFIPDHVHASFDCTTLSIASCSTHRRGNQKIGFTAFSDDAKKSDRVNKNTIKLIKEWLVLNPEMTFTFENPRGILRHMDYMKEFTRYCVWYCKYGDDRAKPTDIWTNLKNWTPRPMCKNFKYNKETGEIIDRHCHHQSARRGAKTGTQGRKGSYERSKIPQQLCEEIVNCINARATPWIPVEQELPEDNGFYNVICETEEGFIVHSMWFINDTWHFDNHVCVGDATHSTSWYIDVTEWQKLPNVPKKIKS